MRTLFARSFLRHDLIVAVVVLAALGACEREAPTGLQLEAVPFVGLCTCVGPLSPPLPGAPVSASGGVVAQPITISLQAVDQSGRTVAGVSVSWAVVHSGGFTNVASSTTDSGGTASVTWTLDSIVKLDSLRASLASGATLLVTAAAQHGKAVLATKISGDSQTVALGGTSEPFIVSVADRYGNPVGGVGVAWLVTGGGTPSAMTTVTDAKGTSQVTATTDANAPGAHQVIATYGVVRASVFTLTASNATTSINAVKRIRVYAHPVSRPE